MADQVAPYPLPRVTIKFCTQCKWMLRAAYYAQELLSTFSTALGEVALQPSTGGTFVVEIFHPSPSPSATPSAAPQARVLWDRRTDGGFPETKELKRRVRDVVEPGRDLGHVDRQRAPASDAPGPAAAAPEAAGEGGKGGKGEGDVPPPLPSRAELQAAGQAGGGGPGEAEAAAQLLGDLRGRGGGEGGKEEACEDCA